MKKILILLTALLFLGLVGCKWLTEEPVTEESVTDWSALSLDEIVKAFGADAAFSRHKSVTAAENLRTGDYVFTLFMDSHLYYEQFQEYTYRFCTQAGDPFVVSDGRLSEDASENRLYYYESFLFPYKTDKTELLGCRASTSGLTYTIADGLGHEFDYLVNTASGDVLELHCYEQGSSGRTLLYRVTGYTYEDKLTDSGFTYLYNLLAKYYGFLQDSKNDSTK